MTARVLVVDDNAANIKLLEARLRAEYFEVLTANSGYEALEICGREHADVVLLDVMMPGMDGFEVCRRLKADPKTQMIPVVMVTALDQPSDRIRGLEAGADDFLAKPVDDIALITRVKNLARVKQLSDELVMRLTTMDQGIAGSDLINDINSKEAKGTLLLVEDRAAIAKRIKVVLEENHEVLLARSQEEAQGLLGKHDIDLVLVSLDMEGADALHFCSHIRSLGKTRHLPIMVLSEQGDKERMLRALDLGVNDFVIRPVDRNELLARVRTQIKRRRFSEHLYKRLEERVEQASRDPLTGMFNRRHLEEQLQAMIEDSLRTQKGLSVILADIDFFKSVNDNYGHDIGDQVLRQFSSRLQQNIRRLDMAFRIGGEEFLIVLPKTTEEKAQIVGERLRAVIEDTPFKISEGDDNITVTTSIGLSSVCSSKDTIDSLLKRADEALYKAKKSGRNQVVSNAA
ncbi:MAG: PleD family two-component system response regulator [Hyphomicrobiaceae bacterium]|nr:PleD family two-component system response regulator [Hyphomicrobiaceae bacterium]